MTRLAVTVNTRQVSKALRKVRRGVPKWTAQELNRQRRRSRTLLTRAIAKGAGIAPQKRVRRRIRFPRNTQATPTRLVAVGLSVTSVFPARYFKTLPPPGGRLVAVSAPDAAGRIPTGEAFAARMPSGHRGTFRRLQPATWIRARRSERWRGRLPIGPSHFVDLSELTGRSIRRVLRELSREFPGQMERRLDRELRRAFTR